MRTGFDPQKLPEKAGHGNLQSQHEEIETDQRGLLTSQPWVSVSSGQSERFHLKTQVGEWLRIASMIDKCTHASMFAHTHMHTHAYVYTHTCTCTHSYMHIHADSQVDTHAHALTLQMSSGSLENRIKKLVVHLHTLSSAYCHLPAFEMSYS